MRERGPGVSQVPASRHVELRSGNGPEAGQRVSIGRLAQLLEGALANLTDPLARDAHERADLFQRHRLGAFLEPVVQVEDLPLAGGEVLREHAVDELAHELEVRHILDIAAVDANEALTER